MTEDDARDLLAAATDLLNTWARERSVQEAYNEKEILQVINRLWDHDSAILFHAEESY